ncbi:hypothetical protein CRU97_03645 [Halarcobacter bivalviorum]|nr:hypothetical protein CRU97_03645 [Halarcobacter bivalviorum]
MLDFLNFIYIIFIFVFIYKYFKIDKIYLMILLCHLIGVFLLNDVLFPADYLPDQFKYLNVAQNIRAFDFYAESNLTYGNTVFVAGIFFALFPIPFIESVYSIAMINFLLYLGVFLFLHKKGFFSSQFIVYFYLLYPSLFFYSSLALREILILSIMFFSIYYLLIEKKYFLSLLILIPLKVLKFQNLYLLLISYGLSFLFLNKLNIKHFLFGIIFLILFFYVFLDFPLLERINLYRKLFYLNNFSINDYIPITSYFDIVTLAIPSAVNMFFRPLIWEEFGLFQLIQFLENCILFIIIFFIWYKKFKYKLYKEQEVVFLNLLLVLSLAIYGLIVFNSGTSVRYKFPFITVYIIFSWYFIYQYEQLLKKSRQCVE